MTKYIGRDYIIYMVHDGDGRARYVGQSCSLPNLAKNAAFVRWARARKRIVVEILEDGLDYWQASKKEKAWIHKFEAEGAELFNINLMTLPKPADPKDPIKASLEKLKRLTEGGS